MCFDMLFMCFEVRNMRRKPVVSKRSRAGLLTICGRPFRLERFIEGGRPRTHALQNRSLIDINTKQPMVTRLRHLSPAVVVAEFPLVAIRIAGSPAF